MSFEGHISESAFLVNESRARRVDLSRDRYARLWVSEHTRDLWEAFRREVYPYDDIELALRNRFFLERLDRRLASGGVEAFVNFGAGFTSYPFLVRSDCSCVEVDHAHVIELKRRRVAQWIEGGRLPERSIEFVSGDFENPADRARIRRHVGRIVRERRSFFLLEGITYYLEPGTWSALLDDLTALQPAGSVLAFDFWTPDIGDHPVLLRFRKFFAERFGHGEARYNLFDADSVRSIQGYRLRELTDVREQECVYSGTSFLADRRRILPESYAVLERSA